MPPYLSITVLRNTKAFAALKDEWEDLYRSCPLATPFQSWAWLYSWWESYGEDYELCLIKLRSEEGLLVGLIPLMLERRWGFGRLLFIGAGPITPYKDVLARKGWERRVADAGRPALEQLDGWQVADLQQVRPEAAAWYMFREWNRPKISTREINYLVINVRPWDELIASLSKNLRKSARNTIRRAEKDGVHYELAGPEDAERAARSLVALHRELWKGRGIDPEHLTKRFESLIAAAARRMTAHQLGSIYEYWRDGEVIVSGFVVFGSEFDGSYMVGASKEALQRYQIDTLAYRAEVDTAYGRNSAHLSLMDGDPPYKMRWASKRVPSYRMVLSCGLAPWVPYAGYCIVRSILRRYAVGSNFPPQWVRKTVRSYSVLRSRVLWYVESEGVPRWIKRVTSKR